MVRRGPLSIFSPTPRFPERKTVPVLRNPEREMRKAETGHLLVFFLMLLFAGYAWLNGWLAAVVWMSLFNIPFNVYPIMLQRYNRIKLQELVHQYGQREVKSMRPTMRLYQTENRLLAHPRISAPHIPSQRPARTELARRAVRLLALARIENQGHGKLEQDVFIWETGGKTNRGGVNREGPGDAFLSASQLSHIGPRRRNAHRRRKAFGVHARKRHVRVARVGRFADDLRHAILTRRATPEALRRNISGAAPVPDAQIARGTPVRALGDGLELLERCYASGLGFHNNDIQIAVENRNDPAWYRNIQNAPLYRRDLDLVAVAPCGAIASFATI